MNKKQKKMLARIIIAAVLLIVLHFVPITGIPRFICYLAVYLVIGYDIVKKAFKGIKNGQVFDENFLMALQRSVHLRWQFMKKAAIITNRSRLCCSTRSVNFSRAMQLERAAVTLPN